MVKDLTIVTQDNLVIIDGEMQKFDISELIDVKKINAVQWHDHQKHIEIRGIGTEEINDLSLVQSIIDIFIKNKTEISSAVQTNFDLVSVTYKSGHISAKTILQCKDIDFIPLMQDQRVILIEEAVKKYLNAKAVSLSYDDINSAVSYANDLVEKFAKEGKAFVVLRGSCWEKCYYLLKINPSITSKEVVSQLPDLVL